MELHDGFIVGIYNYCDRWCEVCPFTSRCRLFADLAATDASLDPAMKAIVEAPPHPPDVPPAPPRWVQEELAAMNEAASEPVSAQDRAYLQPEPAPEHMVIEERAVAYTRRTFEWLRAHEEHVGGDPAGPFAIIAWYHTLIAAKIHRAVTGLAYGREAVEDWPADYDGSAKVALIGIERSHAAWHRLCETGLASRGEADPFMTDLVWLEVQLESAFPNARAFVRPGFDEPDEVARLLSGDMD